MHINTQDIHLQARVVIHIANYNQVKRLNVATVGIFNTQNVATVALFNTQNVATHMVFSNWVLHFSI